MDREHGFSFMEIVAVLILVGILSVSAVSRLNVTSLREASFQQELLSAIRFAQKFAIASGCDVQVDIDAVADTYTLSLRTDVTAAPASCLASSTAVPLAAFGPPLRNPATGGNFTGSQSGIDITDGEIFAYNRQGIPVVPATGVAMAVDGDINVGGQTIVIAAGTGYAAGE